MTNTFNNSKDAPGIIAKAAAMMLADEVQFFKSISKADASDFDGKNGFGAGDTLQISKPARFVPQQAFDITSSIQDITEEKEPLPLDIISTIGVDITSEQFASEIALKNLLNRVVKPAVSSIAQDIEQRFLEKATDATFNSVGTAGSTIHDTDTILAAREKINKFLAPKDANRFFLGDSTSMRNAVNSRKGLFQSSEKIKEQYEMGLIGVADGFLWLENELLNNHLNGNDVTGVAIDSAVLTPASGATSIGVDGLTATTGTVKKGQVFTIATVNAVHPITKTDLGFLQQFVVTADATADGSGLATLSISPAINSTADSIQNVTALHADTDALVFVGAADSALNQSLAFHKNAFRGVSVPLIMPLKAEFAAQETVDGITVAIIRDFDILTRKMVTRFDFLGGLVAERPEWACRITA